jgi:uncharacterized membrane protein
MGSPVRLFCIRITRLNSKARRMQFPPMTKNSSKGVESANRNHFRFHEKHRHLDSVFGGDWFALKAEAFARFFGTPTFLVSQTAVVAVWIRGGV